MYILNVINEKKRVLNKERMCNRARFLIIVPVLLNRARKQPLTGRFWAAMLKAHNSEQNHFFEWEKRQKITKKTSNINVRVLSINLKNGYFFYFSSPLNWSHLITSQKRPFFQHCTTTCSLHYHDYILAGNITKIFATRK